MHKDILFLERCIPDFQGGIYEMLLEYNMPNLYTKPNASSSTPGDGV
jgi:hypothetical protein